MLPDDLDWDGDFDTSKRLATKADLQARQAQAEAESELLAVIGDCVRALRRPATKATLIACADVLESHVRRYRAAKGTA